ncbi:hypothetical protein ACFWVU_25310 [Streptomyces sp. NPDC058686]
MDLAVAGMNSLRPGRVLDVPSGIRLDAACALTPRPGALLV